MKSPSVILPTPALPEGEPIPDYLRPEGGLPPKGNWVFDDQMGEFIWVPVDSVGQPYNSRQPVLQEAPVIPQRPAAPVRPQEPDEGMTRTQ